MIDDWLLYLIMSIFLGGTIALLAWSYAGNMRAIFEKLFEPRREQLHKNGYEAL